MTTQQEQQSLMFLLLPEVRKNFLVLVGKTFSGKALDKSLPIVL